MISEEKYLSCYILLTDQILFIWLPLLHDIVGNMCIVIDCEPDCDVINFKMNLIFLIDPFFLHGQKVKTN